MELNQKNRRVLIIDDTASIHDDIRSILSNPASTEELDGYRALLLGDSKPANAPAIEYEIDSAFQGQEGFEKVRQAREESRPYALAIVDIRMPPGWDGIETIEAIRKIDSEIQIVICTAYTDYSWQVIHDKFKMSDWLLILKKPFDLAEVQQLASAMTEKWHLARQASIKVVDLEGMVEHHASQLRAANAELAEKNNGLTLVNDQLSREIVARQKADERIRHIAFHDALTDLPNRTLLLDRVNCCIQRCKRHHNYAFAVVFIDIDNFKIVNDSLGHPAGDQLLVQIARGLINSLRTVGDEIRPGCDTVARLSGDEFVVLLDDITEEQDVIRIAERILRNVARPTIIDGRQLVPSASIGIAIGQSEYDDAIEILRDADTALYTAKDNGKGSLTVFDRAMRAKVMARMDLENDLRRAIEDQQFVIHYQPIVSLSTGNIESLEALIRWHHPVKGVLFPDSFIPVAESTGLIEAIGQSVIEGTLRQLAEWRSRIPTAQNLSVSVNLSPRQLGGQGLVQYIDERLAEFDLDPRAIKLEITETMMMDNLPLAREIMERFRARDIDVHLDDFGTGYSSLSILHTLPFSAIKLDRSFVRDLSDVESATTVQAVVMLAKNRGIRLIAEGIENVEQLVQLRDLECEFGQGFYFSKPVPPENIERLLTGGPPYSMDCLESAVLETSS